MNKFKLVLFVLSVLVSLKTSSEKGAIGLMQVKPSTAEDPIVGIKDINKLENNIHAAVKYLDFIRKRYFTDKEILPRDSVRFTLTAYNAGPAKINRQDKRQRL